MVEPQLPCSTGSTATAFLDDTKSLSRAAREEAIFNAIAAGSVPSFTHSFVPLTLTHEGRDATVWVALDYATLGTDEDWVRIPMSPLTAQRLADLFGYVLPTRKLVDAIYQAAAVKLTPIPLLPGPEMMSNAYYRRHQELVEKQRADRGAGALIAGHKKDVVISKRLEKQPDRVAIYGWHKANGPPIQPLSLAHEDGYADYSHGIRWLRNSMLLEGMERTVIDVLGNPQDAGILSDEGTIAMGRAVYGHATVRTR